MKIKDLLSALSQFDPESEITIGEQHTYRGFPVGKSIGKIERRVWDQAEVSSKESIHLYYSDSFSHRMGK